MTTTPESSLLLTLEEISQLVSHSHDSAETLANIVQLIQGRFHTDVCSVYLLELDRGELVLGATVGLKPESVGRVRMRLDEGLTGLVAERLQPVMVEDAFQHPRFKFFPDAGEDPYHSFLGVPLVEGGSLQGVLVVQTTEPRSFSPSEIRMLVTVGSQLAPLVSEARLLERIIAVAHAPVAEPAADLGCRSLSGLSFSRGVGIGEAYVVDGFEEWQPAVAPQAGSAGDESARLAIAMDAARDEIMRLSQRVSSLVGEDHGAILQAQLLILQDRKIEQDVSTLITSGATAEAALLRTLETYVAIFEKLESKLFQDRIYDVKDVFRRVLWHLRSGETEAKVDHSLGSKQIVLVARDVSVADLFSIDLDRLVGVVVEHGGPQSHAAILARSLGVPMVGQIAGIAHQIEPGRLLLVDADAGEVTINPGPEHLAAHREHMGNAVRVFDSVAPPAPQSLPQDNARTGLPRIEANINLLYEVPQALAAGAAGVGLYRTEFLFLARRTLPTEEEQVGTYRKLLTMLGGRPASIRTFDLRPDKTAHSHHLSSAASGPLDWRIVLESLPLQRLFRDQVRAILRAAIAGTARILVPLVTRTEQLDFVIETVERARQELERDGLEFNRDVQLGIMLEVTAATSMTESWAEHVDFFAIGTNDLVASALGIDRDDPLVASLNDPLHPGVLRTIRDVVVAAHRAARPVTVCGEMAADPQGCLALAAFQVDSLSLAVHQLEMTQQMLIRQSPDELRAWAADLIGLRTADEARDLIRSHAIR